jgi:hypothetical protein
LGWANQQVNHPTEGCDATYPFLHIKRLRMHFLLQHTTCCPIKKPDTRWKMVNLMPAVCCVQWVQDRFAW